MDYRDLLKKYLKFVCEYEGTYFLGFGSSVYEGALTQAEYDELNEIVDEIDRENGNHSPHPFRNPDCDD